MSDERSGFIKALRTIADVLEFNPDVKVPYFGTQVVRCDSVDEFKRIIEAFGGRWNKKSTDTDYQITHKLHENLSVMAYASHEKVCERVVVGTKHIPETVLPARPETIVPARDEEVVKWICPPLLADFPVGTVRPEDEVPY
jgi:hypothetical protein